MKDDAAPRLAERFVKDLSAGQMATIIASANDIALVVDRDGVVQDVAVETPSGAMTDVRDWIGQPWIETVTVESRPKIEALMNHAPADTPSRWRQVNHPAPNDMDLPIMYRVFHAEEHAIVVGRDLRPLSRVQQQLLDAQHSMETEYARVHHAETRYRMLFQLASEAIVILDADGRSIQEANPAAARLLGENVSRLVRQQLDDYLEDADLTELLAESRSVGHGRDLKVQMRGGKTCVLSATLLRQEDTVLYLVHLKPVETDASQAHEADSLLAAVRRSPDGFVVTDPKGNVMAGNDSFLRMCQLASAAQVINQPLERWLGRTGVDMRVIRKNLDQRGVIRQYATTVNPEFGTPLDVELSAVFATEADPPCLGFVIRQLRSASRGESQDTLARQPLARSLEQMTELVGRVPLKDLVRETTDLIERLCIQAALELTTNNRASAADMLGLSRQSLYVKLRRYGLSDTNTSESKN